MDKSRVIGGVICLLLGVLLAVLNIVLPEDEVVFMIGDTNASIVPAIVLGIIGVVLLAGARTSKGP